MKKIDNKAFKCKKCGNCCKWAGVVYLSQEDIENLAEGLKVTEEDFLSNYTDKYNVYRILKDKPGTTICCFLDNNRCSVWDFKPKQCADYPKEYDKRCPGFIKENRSSSMQKYEIAVKNVLEKMAGHKDYEKGVINKNFHTLQQSIKTASIISVASENGIDPFLDDNKMKVASLDDLFSFERIGKDKLIHKCTRDLWAIDSDKEGNVQITRLFDNSGDPIKG
jgi:Fe-S-cluster containining protein